MAERSLSNKLQNKQRQGPHGLSRDTHGHPLLPMVIGLLCAAIVLMGLWAAYTYG